MAPMSGMEHQAKITGRSGTHAAFVANLLPPLVCLTPRQTAELKGRGRSPPLPQIRARSFSLPPPPPPFTRAEGGVAQVRGEPDDQPSRPEEQPGHSARSQDAGAPTPEMGARDELRSRKEAAHVAARTPTGRVTGTERSARKRPWTH